MNLIILVLSFLLVLKRGNLLPAEYPEDYGLLIRDREVFDFIIIGAGNTNLESIYNKIISFYWLTQV